MGYGEFTRAAARPSASAAGRRRWHDVSPSPTRDAAGCTLKQHLWGARYVDDLVQIAVNDDPTDANEADCESFYYPMQNANFNVIGLSDANGTLVERYEYTPYGQRTVYKKAGSNEALTTAPLLHSQRVETDTGRAPYGLCAIGHQGLMHDEEFGLVYNRMRYLDPRTGRWLQRDPGPPGPDAPPPVGEQGVNGQYADGLHLYQYVRSMPVIYVDPMGAQASQPAEPVDICKLLGGKPCEPTPIPSNTRVKIPVNLGTLGLLENACAEMTITQVANVRDNLKYTNIALLGGKPCNRVKINVPQALNPLVGKPIKHECLKKAKDKDGKDTWVPDPDKECCYKASSKGQYPITVNVSITVPVAGDSEGRDGGFCSITGNVQATLTGHGKVGQCVRKQKKK